MVFSPGTINYENKDDHDHDDDGDHDHDDDDEENYDVTISDIDQMVFSPAEFALPVNCQPPAMYPLPNWSVPQTIQPLVREMKSPKSQK